MRRTTLVSSALFHGVLAILALRTGSERRPSQIAVAVVNEAKRKEPENKRPEPPPPPAPPPPAARPVRAASRPSAPPAPAPLRSEPKVAPSRRSTTPLDSGLTFGNQPAGEPGSGGSGSPSLGSPTTPVTPPVEPPVTKRHVPAPKKEEPPEDLCEEAPSKPVALQQPTQIEYTAQARADGVEGRLVLRVIVAADGTVTEVVVVQGVEAALDAGAVAAVKTWTFKPALRCGKPVAGGILTLARRFELGD